MAQSNPILIVLTYVLSIFSTSHVIPHDRAMVLIPGVIYLHALQKVISVWYPTEITFCRPTEGYFCRACQVLTLRQVMQPSLSNFVSTYKKKSSKFGDNVAGGGDRNLRSSTYRTDALAY